MKAVQYFSNEALERSKALSSDQVVEFVENYRMLHSVSKSRSKLISIKISEHLLEAFKIKCVSQGVKYQTKMKELMKAYLD